MKTYQEQYEEARESDRKVMKVIFVIGLLIIAATCTLPFILF